MTRKLIGTVFEAIALCIFIVNAVLMNIDDLGLEALLLFLGASLFFIGFIVYRLPSEPEKE